MRIAIAGKGGSGKTTVAAVLSRLLAAAGRRVIAVDADSNPNLAVALGLAPGTPLPLLSADLVETVVDQESGLRQLMLRLPFSEVVERYGVDAPGGVRLMVASHIDHPGSGCNCAAHAVVRTLLASVAVDPLPDGTFVVVDLEAGLEHLKRGTPRHSDVLFVVAEPFFRSAQTAVRTVELARELGIPEVGVVLNKLRPEDDVEALVALFERSAPVVARLPYDDAVRDADAEAASVLDVAPASVLVDAVRTWCQQLCPAEAAGTHG